MPIGYTPTGVVFTSYTYYGNYMVRTKVANYDAITGGYHSNGISSAAANPLIIMHLIMNLRLGIIRLREKILII